MTSPLSKTSSASFNRSLRNIDHALQKGHLIRNDLKVVEKHGIKWVWVVFVNALITAFTFLFNNDPWKAYRIRSLVHSLKLFVHNNHEHLNSHTKKRLDHILKQLKVKTNHLSRHKMVSSHAICLFQKDLKAAEVPPGNIARVCTALLNFGNNIARYLDQSESFSCAPISLMTMLTIALHLIQPANKAQYIQNLGLKGLSEQDIQQAMAALLSELGFPKTYSEGAISFSQAIGFKKDVVVAQSFQDLVTQVYGGNIIQSDDLETQANEWVAAQTQNEVPSILSDNLSQFVLLSSLYLKLNWQLPFVKPAGGWPVEKFTCIDGSTADVSMMQQDNDFTIFLGSAFNMIELPYFSIDSRMLSMLVFIPHMPRHLQQLHQKLGKMRSEELKSYRDNGKQYAKLSLPKIRLACEMHLLDAFKAMGFPLDAIDKTIVSEGTISDILHRAYFSTNENGTDAAAVSAVNMKALPKDPVELIFSINQAFTFVITDEKNIVYARGSVADKTALVVD